MKLLNIIHPNWRTLFLYQETKLKEFASKLSINTLSPSKELVFEAFKLDPKALKLVVVGQDPYPSKRHATGHAFDVSEGTTRKSFEVFQIIGKDYGIEFDSFKPLINNNVFLLNTNLTTKAGLTNMHDWSWFTSKVVKHIKELNPTCQFVFLGRVAQKINEVGGINMYHPIANLRSGKKLLNKSFFELTEKSVNWKELYKELPNAST